MPLCLTSLPGTLPRLPFGRRELEAVIQAMLERAGVAEALVDLALLDDAAMQTLHATALGCPGPTNILSFPASDAEREDGATPERPGIASVPGRRGGSREPGASRRMRGMWVGSLALSVDTLRREAFLYGQTVDEHAVRLLAHGLAHLLGHDHGPAMDALTESLEEAGLFAAARLIQV